MDRSNIMIDICRNLNRGSKFSNNATISSFVTSGAHDGSGDSAVTSKRNLISVVQWHEINMGMKINENFECIVRGKFKGLFVFYDCSIGMRS